MSRLVALFGRPAFLRAFHGWATVAWLLLIVPSLLLWRSSVPYLVAVSVYANCAGHFSSWQAARTEVRQDEAIEASTQ